MTSHPTAANGFAWWLVTGKWNRLHAVPGAAITRDQIEMAIEFGWRLEPTATALCGLDASWTMPGTFSRLGLPRCAHCCRRLRIPPGNGTPANEQEAG
ncbi:MAG TPA: hypothetical protein VIV12_29310 [Streptosporangiaceae bacterium]